MVWNGKGGISYLIRSFSVGKQARIFTSYVRSLGVHCRQYIDDKHVGQLASGPRSNKTVTRWSDFDDAATFMSTSVLVSLCYFIGLSKSCLVPQQLLTFLGFIVDSTLCTFLIPEVKKKKFADLHESILSSRSVSVKTLQRFAVKVSSFSIAVPSARYMPGKFTAQSLVTLNHSV